MQIRTFIIDSFTDQKFSGNPAGVCLLDVEINNELMQSIAAELNLSETAFLGPTDQLDQFSIRYFTPTVEVDFCGHASLASAKMVLDTMDMEKVSFITEKNLKITAQKSEEFIEINFPLYPTRPYEMEVEVLDAFGISNPIEIEFCSELGMAVVEVASKEELIQLTPDYSKAIKATQELNELVVTTRSLDSAYDFYSRCFCPWIGINEDPVTGAAHSVLAKYWSEKLGKKEMAAFQVSKRGGFLFLRILDNHNLQVRSKAQIVLVGGIQL
ncbi:MAG: PhzF family phenazine biosynthesis isomerase [Saprospiraceae bacterium]|nr:PhzF family phenazine biosynthesis isomerase [Saprospiraceae bacterium]